MFHWSRLSTNAKTCQIVDCLVPTGQRLFCKRDANNYEHKINFLHTVIIEIVGK